MSGRRIVSVRPLPRDFWEIARADGTINRIRLIEETAGGQLSESNQLTYDLLEALARISATQPPQQFTFDKDRGGTGMVKEVRKGHGDTAWEVEYDNGQILHVTHACLGLDGSPPSVSEAHLVKVCAAYFELQNKHKGSDPIYAMGLHETIENDTHTITRVPGGWVYWNIAASNSVFVPYHNEFQ